MSDSTLTPRDDEPVLRGFPVIEWEDGYPTDESLEAFRAVPPVSFGVLEAETTLRRELAACAEHCCASYEEAETEHFGRPVIECFFSTGGWSGAEAVIGALLQKFWIRYLHVSWRRGGHFVFQVSSDTRGVSESNPSKEMGCE